MELLLTPPSALPKPMQTRASFEAASPVLQEVQIADELGFAYLVGDIDFGAVGRDEIFQNIRFIILTEYFSTPLDREFGFDYSMIDKPMAIAEAIFAQECALKISLYEPRAQFRSIDYVRDEMIGKLSPSVVVALLTIEELPMSLPFSGETGAASVPGGTTVEEADLPSFYESLIEMARVPGPPGSIGPEGDAATIEVGVTTTGAAGTSAEVVNVGDSNAAIFDFTIPKGDKGDQGTGVNIKGTVPTSGSLPMTGNQPGDMWIASDTGHGWTWDGDSWVDAGPIQGPVGPQGDVGPQGPTGATGAQGTPGEKWFTGSGDPTSVPGAANGDFYLDETDGQVWERTSGSWILRCDITGPQGLQGNIGSQGPQGNTGAAGPSNILSVQSTTTGAPGTNANVTVSGTSPAQTLAFVIPRGDVGTQGSTGATGPQGIQGSQGVQGVQGAQGANAFTITSANFDVPAEGASVLVTLADASWVTVGQMVAVQTAGGTLADAHSFEVTAKTGNQVTLKNVGSTYITGSGDVIGPVGAVDGSLAAFDGTSGKLIKSTPIATIVPVGGILQTKFWANPGNITSNTVIPADGTIPQSGEGSQIASIVFTPLFANSWVRLTVMAAVTISPAAGWMSLALFRNPIANAISWQTIYVHTSGGSLSFAIDKFDQPASVSAITYNLRMGPGVGTQTMTIAGAGPITFAIQEIKQ